MPGDEWVEWGPKWAPHVKGRYTKRIRDEVTGMCEPQKVHMLCSFKGADGKVCGGVFQTQCGSGNVRGHINKFAAIHAHKDFENPPLVVRPGSKRASVLDARKKPT